MATPSKSGGRRPDAEPTDRLPTLIAGRDRLPTICRHCGSTDLEAEEPLGRHRFGTLTCRACSRELAWLGAPLARIPIRGGSDDGVATVDRPLVRIGFRRQEGCGPACSALYGHDPITHEQYGYQRAVDERHGTWDAIVETGPLAIDLGAGTATLDGALFGLSPLEYRALAVLAADLGRLVRHEHLVVGIWGVDELALQTGGASRRWHAVRILIMRLRDRLGPRWRDLIETVPGRGYRLREETPTYLEER